MDHLEENNLGARRSMLHFWFDLWEVIQSAVNMSQGLAFQMPMAMPRRRASDVSDEKGRLVFRSFQ